MLKIKQGYIKPKGKTMTRAEMFAAAKEKADAEEAARKERGNYTQPDYEDIPHVALETGKVRVFRFVGMPHTVRSEPSDPKLVTSSWILDDKKGYFVCKWSEEKNWILWRVYNEVMKYTWDKDAINTATGKPGVKVYPNALAFPHIFNRVRYNNKDDANGMEKGWQPARSVYMNCLSRDSYDWHKENKSYALISKKATEKKDDKGVVSTRYEEGIGTTTYDALLKSAVEEHGAWDDFDIAVRKLNTDPWYEVYSFFDARKIAKDLNCEMNGDALTEEELSWKKIDIDKITQVTSYRKIQNRLGEFIKEVDACLKTNFTAELEKLVAEEKAKWDAEKKVEQEDAKADLEKTPAKTEEKKAEEPKVRTRSSETKKLDMWEQAKANGWKMVDELKAEFEDVVFSISADGKEIVYKDDEGKAVPKAQTIPCPDCNLDTSEIIPFCPRCSAKF